MKFIRVWKDNGDEEEIPENLWREKVTELVKDFDLALSGALDGLPIQSNFCYYKIIK